MGCVAVAAGGGLVAPGVLNVPVGVTVAVADRVPVGVPVTGRVGVVVTVPPTPNVGEGGSGVPVTAVPVPPTTLNVGLANSVAVAWLVGPGVPVGPTVGNIGVLIPMKAKAAGSAVVAANGLGCTLRSTCTSHTSAGSGPLPQP